MKTLGILLLAIAFLSSCKKEEKHNMELRIAHEKIDCDGDGISSCYMIQHEDRMGQGSWEVLQADIEGFDYEAGYTYDILVQQYKIYDANDEPTTYYKFKKVLDKTKY